MTKERLGDRLRSGRLTKKQKTVLHNLATEGPGHAPNIALEVDEGRTTVQKNLESFERWSFVESERVLGHRGGEPAKRYRLAAAGLWWWLCKGAQTWQDVCDAAVHYSKTLPHVLGKTRVYEKSNLQSIFLSLVRAFNPLEPPPWITVGAISVQPVWPQGEEYDETTLTFYRWADLQVENRYAHWQRDLWKELFNDSDMARLKKQIHQRITEAYDNLALQLGLEKPTELRRTIESWKPQIKQLVVKNIQHQSG